MFHCQNAHPMVQAIAAAASGSATQRRSRDLAEARTATATAAPPVTARMITVSSTAERCKPKTIETPAARRTMTLTRFGANNVRSR
jgi:hypothetical protein